MPQKKTKVGAKMCLSPKGLFGLMFLKHYTNLSDRKLIDCSDTDWAMQLFCGIQLLEDEMINDRNMPSRVKDFMHTK